MHDLVARSLIAVDKSEKIAGHGEEHDEAGKTPKKKVEEEQERHRVEGLEARCGAEGICRHTSGRRSASSEGTMLKRLWQECARKGGNSHESSWPWVSGRDILLLHRAIK
eukprot:scaffold101_cov230-Pinguiococcus_pyrenoidosus.AAC.18